MKNAQNALIARYHDDRGLQTATSSLVNQANNRKGHLL